ncbi:PREDICTED: carbohydrate sulfotransferase 11-like [Wasmannia auropunctata]|uniref:carbohydrate sulfotransferase 11-like n=1 Tax=Wasmannia auropunctata TaxID=64793 RepID=UPI0005EF7EAC|nr:PREDICTED: carbohydrate sulfotransferase 11-like [Wasmannia auropunctata]XP_011695249.1 PREDICTED: carbohydrate sulfotransferase 11-like [Wasmannia auropunctata]
MSIRTQFFKYSLCMVLFFLICIILIETRKSCIVKETTGVTIKCKSKLKTPHFPASDRTIKKNVESEINMLRIDELKGGTIDLQESATILQQVSSVCAKYKLKTPLVKRHFLYNAEHKSLYCWIRKIASTSFTKLFSDMSNRQVDHDLYKEVDFLSPESLKDLQRFANNNTVFKLLVVRHPFHRLVSSYRDRIEDNSKYTAQSWLYARQILHLSRPELFRANASSGNILQRIFLADRRLKVVPSFREFLEWLLRQPPGHDDVHWDQYHTHCAVCNVRYNFILKLDEYTFGQVNYILTKLKLNKDKIYLPRLQRTRAGITDFDVTCKYFSDLTTDMVLRLYKRYKIDFEMYNYKLEKYLHCARGKKLT